MLLLLAPGAGLHAAGSWTRARTQHFVLVGDARPSVTGVVAGELERFRSAVEQATPLRFQPGTRTVYVFKNARSFRAAAGAVRDVRRVQGLSVNDDTGNVLLAITDSPDAGLERIRHELVHALLESKDPPLWLGEGVAQYLSFFETAGTEVTLGLPPLSLAGIEDCAWRPLFSFLSLKDYPRSERETCGLYLESALLVQNLAERPGGLAGLFAFVDRIAGGEPAADALRAQYGIELPALDAELKSWTRAARESRRLRLRVHVPVAAQAVAVDRLSALEHLLSSGDLKLAFDDHSGAAAAYRKALDLDPNDLSAVAGLGIALAGTKDNAEAIALLEWTEVADVEREGLTEAHAVALLGRGFERGGTGLGEDHRKVRQLARALDARPRDRLMRAVLLGVASLADPDPEAAAFGRAALEDGVEKGVPLSVMAPGLLIFAARAGDDEELARLRAAVSPDEDFQAMARAVADGLRAAAWVRSVWDQAERVEALAGPGNGKATSP